ncbi:hypothetical protein KC19_1G256000 [Ceratodon purpureus]|uniref:Uncharacterized protein n=1 Tax=Ceratodon purpureus TaxID=3225 RepID=A0A8T0JAF1_CERPU|nr:hypothetical protein KC19_1G256000 [Ceratodon purpureus]
MAHYHFFSWPNSHLFSRTDIPLLKPRTAQKLSTTSSSSPAPHLHATPNALSHRLPRLTPLRTQTKIIFSTLQPTIRKLQCNKSAGQVLHTESQSPTNPSHKISREGIPA